METAHELSARTWRDEVSQKLGTIEQGMLDLGRNFDTWRKEFDGNGQPGRCALEKIAMEDIKARLRTIEDARRRSALETAVWRILQGIAVIVGAGAIAGALRHFLRF